MPLIRTDIPNYPAEKPYQQQAAGGYYNPFDNTSIVPLVVVHSARGDKGVFAKAAYAEPYEAGGEIRYVLLISFKNKMFRYPRVTAASPAELQSELNARQGPSLSLACNPKSDQAHSDFLYPNYEEV